MFLNSKFNLQIKKRKEYTLHFLLKKNTKKEKNISYVHPIISTQCIDHDPYFGEGSAKLVLDEAATADSPP